MHRAKCQGVWVLILLGCSATGSSSLVAKPQFSSRNDPLVSLRPPDMPDDDALEAAGARIGSISIRALDIFDTSRPDENTALFHTANRLHVETLQSTIRDRLLFVEGEPYRAQRLKESERLLRDTRYLYDAVITPIRYADGKVDIEVVTRDVWTLNPGVSFGRSGGKNTSGFELEELNLLGRGIELNFKQNQEIDRDITALRIFDPQIGHSWWSARADYEDNSDGSVERFMLDHPFYSLETRWAGGVNLESIDQIDSRYALGERVGEYRARRREQTAYVGHSKGLNNGYVWRWSGGYTRDERQFDPVPGSSRPTLVPDDRELAYPWAQLEWLEDDFRTERNRDQIERTEDRQYGWRVRARLGYSSGSFGADRTAWLLDSSVSKGVELDERSALLFDARYAARLESNVLRDALLESSVRYYRRHSDRRLMFASLTVDAGERLDADRQIMLGGDNGLRGYPLRYQQGEGRWLATVEQRWFTTWYPFRLFHVGGAIFADVGGTWGEDYLGRRSSSRVLGDVGFGLRLGNSRSALGNVLHIDLAFPLNADKSINNVQLLIETKRSF